MYLKVCVLPCVGQMVALSKGTEEKHEEWCESYSMFACSKEPIPEAVSHLSPDRAGAEELAAVSLLRWVWTNYACVHLQHVCALAIMLMMLQLS